MNLALNRRELDKKGIFHSNKKKKKQRNNSRLKERTLSRATIHSPISKCFQPASQTHLPPSLPISSKNKTTSLLTGNRYHPPTRRVNLLSNRSAIHVPPTPSTPSSPFSGLIIGKPINWVVAACRLTLFSKNKITRGSVDTTTRRPKTEPNGPEFGIDPVTSILNTPIEPTTPSSSASFLLSLSLWRQKGRESGSSLGVVATLLFLDFSLSPMDDRSDFSYTSNVYVSIKGWRMTRNTVREVCTRTIGIGCTINPCH